MEERSGKVVVAIEVGIAVVVVVAIKVGIVVVVVATEIGIVVVDDIVDVVVKT